MRFYSEQHAFYCGVDLHARKMYVSVVDDGGGLVEQRNLDAGPEPFLSLVRPYRERLVVGCECMFAWYWLADLCRGEGIDFVLGHALYMPAPWRKAYRSSTRSPTNRGACAASSWPTPTASSSTC